MLGQRNRSWEMEKYVMTVHLPDVYNQSINI